LIPSPPQLASKINFAAETCFYVVLYVSWSCPIHKFNEAFSNADITNLQHEDTRKYDGDQ
jgi:hypothetical protein